MRIRRALSLSLLAALTMSLVACAPSDSENTPTSTPTRSAGITLSATPSPMATAEPDAAAVVVGTTSLRVVDSTGATLEELSFGTPTADVAAALSYVFGSEPTVTDIPGGAEWWPTRNYEWNGFMLRDEITDAPPTEILYWDYYVVVSGDSVNGITIRTEAGTHVGERSAGVVFDDGPWGTWDVDGNRCGSELTYSPTGLFQNSIILMVCVSDSSGLVHSITVPVAMQV